MNQAIRQAISDGIKKLRKERRLTQWELAKLLGLSQAHFSKIERGQGTISAEQLINLVQKYNLPLSYFTPPEKPSKYEEDPYLQNALAYLGANHLRPVPQVEVPKRLEFPEETILETLVASSPRLITALAPVIVKHCEKINFHRIAEKLRIHGIQNRLWWVIEGTYLALTERLKEAYLPTVLHQDYQKAFLLLERKKADAVTAQEHLKEDELDEGLISARTVELVKKNNDKLAKRWGIVTRIKKEDFLRALKDAEET